MSHIKARILLFFLLTTNYNLLTFSQNSSIKCNGKIQFSVGLSKKSTPFQLSGNLILFNERKTEQVGVNFNVTLYSGYLGSKLTKMNAINNNKKFISIINFYSSGTFFVIRNFDNKYYNYERIKEFRPINQIVNSIQSIPYKYSGSIATSFIFTNNNFQRVGSINFRIGDIALGYFNDGPPFDGWIGACTGDGEDRWFTGGGYIEYSDNRNSYYWYFERFTGYNPFAFKVSNLLMLTNTIYSKDEELYNLGSTGIGIKSKSFQASINLLGNDKIDIQNLIHRFLSINPIHYSIAKSNLFINAGYSQLFTK